MRPVLRPLLLSLALLSAIAAPAWAHAPGPREAQSLGAAADIEPMGAPAGRAPLEPAGILAPASASVPPSTDPGPTPWLDVVWWLVVALAVVAAPAVARNRRAVAGATAALLVALAFESAVHSVHHLGSDADASRCSVASVAAHLGGLLEKPVTVGMPGMPAEALRQDTPSAVRVQPVTAAPARSPPLATSRDSAVPPRG